MLAMVLEKLRFAADPTSCHVNRSRSLSLQVGHPAFVADAVMVLGGRLFPYTASAPAVWHRCGERHAS